MNGRDSKGSGRQANGEGSQFRETKSDKETVCSERILSSKGKIRGLESGRWSDERE